MTGPKTKCTFDALTCGKAYFLMTRQNFIFAALLRGIADFLMTCQEGANLLHYYVSKQVFS